MCPVIVSDHYNIIPLSTAVSRMVLFGRADLQMLYICLDLLVHDSDTRLGGEYSALHGSWHFMSTIHTFVENKLEK